MPNLELVDFDIDSKHKDAPVEVVCVCVCVFVYHEAHFFFGRRGGGTVFYDVHERQILF